MGIYLPPNSNIRLAISPPALISQSTKKSEDVFVGDIQTSAESLSVLIITRSAIPVVFGVGEGLVQLQEGGADGIELSYEGGYLARSVGNWVLEFDKCQSDFLSFLRLGHQA